MLPTHGSTPDLSVILGVVDVEIPAFLALEGL